MTPESGPAAAPTDARPWLDLTRAIHPGMAVYAEPGYRDVDTEITPWCTIAERGFATERLVLGSQCGTHLDAPAHMVPGGATVDRLPIGAGCGPYRLSTLTDLAGPATAEAAVVLDARDRPQVSCADLDRVVALGALVVVLAGEVRVADGDPLHLHRALARAGSFLVEDLDADACTRLPQVGELIVVPWKLTGTSGAPASVWARSRFVAASPVSGTA